MTLEYTKPDPEGESLYDICCAPIVILSVMLNQGQILFLQDASSNDSDFVGPAQQDTMG